jgi:hypothetical protein
MTIPYEPISEFYQLFKNKSNYNLACKETRTNKGRFKRFYLIERLRVALMGLFNSDKINALKLGFIWYKSLNLKKSKT